MTRADVAAVVARVLDDERTVGAQWGVVGGSVPLEESLAAALDARTDA